MGVKDSKTVLEKSEKIALLLAGKFKDIEALTEHSLEKIWDNQYDKVWNRDAPAAAKRR